MQEEELKFLGLKLPPTPTYSIKYFWMFLMNCGIFVIPVIASHGYVTILCIFAINRKSENNEELNGSYIVHVSWLANSIKLIKDNQVKSTVISKLKGKQKKFLL